MYFNAFWTVKSSEDIVYQSEQAKDLADSPCSIQAYVPIEIKTAAS